MKDAHKRIVQIDELLQLARQALGPSTREVLEAAETRNVRPDQTQEGMRVRLGAEAYQQLALEKLADLVEDLVGTLK